MQTEMVLFTSREGDVSLPVTLENDTVWLTQEQMSKLFEKNRSVITKHLHNIFHEGEVDEKSNVHFLHIPNSDRPVAVYDLDIIISIGYRVHSRRGVEFRRWATGILRDYTLKGYAVNRKRLAQLHQAVEVMERAEEELDVSQVLSVVHQYSGALDLLDRYDHLSILKPQGTPGDYRLTYEECRDFINAMQFAGSSELFGNEKDDSFAGSINAIYQTFGGAELYPSREEKAANLLYFIVKNHSFSDGNKRIGAALFLYYLEKSGILRNADGQKRIGDHTLVALTVMIAESPPQERQLMVNLVMTFLA